MVENPKLDAATKAKLRDAFLSLDKDEKGKQILTGIMVDKFIVPRDEDYNSVREMEKFLAAKK